MDGKSLLNPNATPYIPISLHSSGAKSGEVKSADEKNQSRGKLPVSDVSSSEFNFEDDAFLEDESSFTEKQTLMDDPHMIMESLSYMFPDVSMESLAASLCANGGDLERTIHMLEQLECTDDIPEASGRAGPEDPSQRNDDSK